MGGYLAVAAYLAAACAAAAWLCFGRKAMLRGSALYRRAMALAARCEDYAAMRTICVTAPTRACGKFYSWRDMLTPAQLEALPGLAESVQAESLAVRRELAEIVMQAGQANPWLRSEVMQAVRMAEEASSPDFIVKYGYKGQDIKDTIYVPAMSLYLEQEGRRAG